MCIFLAYVRIDAGEIFGFDSERDWLPTANYVNVSLLLRLHAWRQRLPWSYFLRVWQRPFKHIGWRTWRLIHVDIPKHKWKFKFLTNTFFYFVHRPACYTTLCPTRLSRSSTSNDWDRPHALVVISSSATDTTVPLWAMLLLVTKNIGHIFYFSFLLLISAKRTTATHLGNHAICNNASRY